MMWPSPLRSRWRRSSCRVRRAPGLLARAEAPRLGGSRPLLALGYLAYPWVAMSAASDPPRDLRRFPLFLFCIWFLDTDRLVPFAVCAVLAMSTGELMGLRSSALGVWYALARGQRSRCRDRNRRAGVDVLAIYVVVPAFCGGLSSFYGFYDHVGGSPHGVVRMRLHGSDHGSRALFEVHDIAYLRLAGRAALRSSLPPRPGSPPSRCRSSSSNALGLPLDDRSAVPQPPPLAIVPFLCSRPSRSPRRSPSPVARRAVARSCVHSASLALVGGPVAASGRG